MFIISSVPVSAESVDTSNYTILAKVVYANSATGPFYDRGSTVIDLTDNDYAIDLPDSSNAVLDSYTEFQYHIYNNDKSILFTANSSVTFQIQGIFTTYSTRNDSEFFPHAYDFYLQYTDGTISTPSDEITMISNVNTLLHGFKLSFKPSKDVEKVVISERHIYSYNQAWWDTSSTTGAGVRYAPYSASLKFDSELPVSFEVDQESKTESLLGGILDSLTGGFNDLFGGIKDVFNAITDLPSKIWEFIENGLKSLFVPDEEYMTGYKDKWDLLLADKFGAVYQVVQITFGAWDDIGVADETNTINMPEVSIPLPDNSSFSFGGHDIQIVPDGFSVIIDTLKLMVGIACTFLFVNGLRKRYDEIMGVEK